MQAADLRFAFATGVFCCTSPMLPQGSHARVLPAFFRADVRPPACSTSCTFAVVQTASRVQCAAGGGSEPGADAGGGEGGPDKGGGTSLPSKPVCTWVCGGTAKGLARAAQRLGAAWQWPLPRAASDVLRHGAPESAWIAVKRRAFG